MRRKETIFSSRKTIGLSGNNIFVAHYKPDAQAGSERAEDYFVNYYAAKHSK